MRVDNKKNYILHNCGVNFKVYKKYAYMYNIHAHRKEKMIRFSFQTKRHQFLNRNLNIEYMQECNNLHTIHFSQLGEVFVFKLIQ